MSKRTQLLLTLIVLCLIDIVIPIPILGLLLVNVILTRPPWFRNLVHEVYGD